MNRFGTKLCSIVLCAAMLGPMMSGPGAPSASAEGLFGGLSLSERLQSRRAERGSLLDRLAQGREERQARRRSFGRVIRNSPQARMKRERVCVKRRTACGRIWSSAPRESAAWKEAEHPGQVTRRP